MLPVDVLSDINATIGISRLSSEVHRRHPKRGSDFLPRKFYFYHGQSPPVGYSLLQLGELNELVWDEKASTGISRHAFDGVEEMDGKIYFAGGKDGSGPKNIAEICITQQIILGKRLTKCLLIDELITSSVLNDKL